MRNGWSARLALTTAALTLLGGLVPAVASASSPASTAGPGPATVGNRPAPVRGVAPYETGHTVRVTWTNPATPFAKVTVRYLQGRRAPESPTDGVAVPLRTAKPTSVALSGLAPGARYSVAVWTSDAAHHYSRAAITRFTTLRPADPPATISGTVTDTSGHPLANAKVFIETFSGLGTDGTRTDAAGHYSLVVDRGSYYVGVDGALAHGGVSDATGYQSDLESVEDVVAGETRSGVDATLAPGAAITGRVTDAAGHPLTGVVPVAEPVGPYVETTTSSSFTFFAFFGPTDTNPSAVNGTFAIKGLPAATVQVCLDPTTDPVSGGTSDRVGYVGHCATRSVTVRVGRSVDVGSTALRGNPGGVITGTVTYPSGAPASGVFIEAVQTGRDFIAELGYGYTDAAGRYRITVSRGNFRVCGDPSISDATPVNALSACTPSIHITRGDVRTGNIRLRPAAEVAGRIIGPDGRPLADAAVELSRAGRHFRYAATAFTDAHGQFTAVGLPAGDYAACVTAPFASDRYPTGLAPSCFDRRSPIPVRLGAVRLGMDGRLQVGGAISGHVTDDSGALTGDALVDIWGPRGGFDDEAVVQSDGSFLVTGLPTGLYRVCASWFPPFDGAAFVVGFSFLEECRSAPVSVTAGQTTTGVDRSVATGGSVRVSVHDADGRPVGGVDVAALSTCPSDDFCSTIPLFDPRRDVSVADSQVTAADGTVTLHGLPAGEYAICLFGYYGSTVAGSPRTGYADSCAGHSFNVEVTDHQTTEVARELDDGGMITGTITDAAGTPLAGVQVVVSHAATSDYVDAAEYDPFVPDGPAADAVTDAHGRFQVRGVTPGEQTVCANAVQATGGSVRTGYLDGCFGGSTAKTATPVAVQADASTDVRFSLAAGAAISGRVTLASGHTQFIEVVAIRGRHGYVTGVARNGDYRIVRLPAGTYQVCFLAFRYQSQCFDDVRWRDGRRIPRAAARIVLAAGTERRGVGAVLRRAK